MENSHTASIQDTFTGKRLLLLIFDNARQNKAKSDQSNTRSFRSQQVDDIGISPISRKTDGDVVLEEAREAGISVIVMDREVSVDNKSLYVTRVGSDFNAEGENAGLWLADHLEEQGRSDEEINIVILQGTEGATSTIGRTEGFAEIAAQHDNWNILEQTGADYTTTKAREEMERILSRA